MYPERAAMDLSGKQPRTVASSRSLSLSHRRLSMSREAVPATSRWFHLSWSGTFSRFKVVRYGPFTRKPQCVSRSVGKYANSIGSSTR